MNTKPFGTAFVSCSKKYDLLALIRRRSKTFVPGNFITTKPPVGHPTWWFSQCLVRESPKIPWFRFRIYSKLPRFVKLQLSIYWQLKILTKNWSRNHRFSPGLKRLSGCTLDFNLFFTSLAQHTPNVHGSSLNTWLVCNHLKLVTYGKPRKICFIHGPPNHPPIKTTPTKNKDVILAIFGDNGGE